MHPSVWNEIGPANKKLVHSFKLTIAALLACYSLKDLATLHHLTI